MLDMAMDVVRETEMVDDEWCSANKGTILRNYDNNCDWNSNDVDVWMQMEQQRWCNGDTTMLLGVLRYPSTREWYVVHESHRHATAR